MLGLGGSSSVPVTTLPEGSCKVVNSNRTDPTSVTLGTIALRYRTLYVQVSRSVPTPNDDEPRICGDATLNASILECVSTVCQSTIAETEETYWQLKSLQEINDAASQLRLAPLACT